MRHDLTIQSIESYWKQYIKVITRECNSISGS